MKLKFTPTAWAKLLFLRDVGDTEVGGFGICPSSTDNPILVEDIELVEQQCTWATVSFDDNSVADLFDDQVTKGLKPDQFARVWIHTHPGNSAHPSLTDEETFERVFGSVDWAVMFILACGGECYARLRHSIDGHTVEELLDVEVDYTVPFQAPDFDEWEAEYLANVTETAFSHFDFPDQLDSDDGFPEILPDPFGGALDDPLHDPFASFEDEQRLQLIMEQQYYHEYD